MFVPLTGTHLKEALTQAGLLGLLQVGGREATIRDGVTVPGPQHLAARVGGEPVWLANLIIGARRGGGVGTDDELGAVVRENAEPAVLDLGRGVTEGFYFVAYSCIDGKDTP